MMNQIKVIVDSERSLADIFHQGTVSSAGYDLIVPQKTFVNPGEIKMVDMGFKMEIPKGTFAMVVPRSSLYKRGLKMANSIGIIDSDYRGPICVPLQSFSDTLTVLEPGDRIVQMIFSSHYTASFRPGNLNNSSRGEGGFGSTGTSNPSANK